MALDNMYEAADQHVDSSIFDSACGRTDSLYTGASEHELLEKH